MSLNCISVPLPRLACKKWGYIGYLNNLARRKLSSVQPQPRKKMIRVSVLYPQREGARFDWAYYLGTHMPMVARKFGTAAKATSVEQGIGSGAPDAPAPYVAIASFTFDSVPAFQAAFGPHAQEIMADIPQYTSIQPVVQISEIKSGA